jgi:hypothetical protein
VVLVEHQSTINHNMPLRLLEYVADLYSGMLIHEQKFQENLVSLPWPDFIVLYNGEKPLNPHGDDQITLSLAEAFRQDAMI